MTPPIVSRRTLLGSAAAAAGLATGALAGCSNSSGSSGTTDVQLWHLFTGGDGGVFQSMMADVPKDYPDIHIDPIVLTWGGPYYTKLAMASVGGRPPDIAVMHATRVFGYAPGGLLEPWDVNRLAEYGISRETISPVLWDNCLVNDELYAVPLDFHPTVLFFNTEICDAAGVLDGDGKLTGLDAGDGGDAFLSMLSDVTDSLGSQALSFGYTGDGAQMSRVFWTLYNQTGATCELTPGKDLVFDHAKGVQVIDFVQSMLNGELALKNQDYGAAVSAFSTQRSGLIISGEWESVPMHDAGIPFDGTVFPQIFEKPATYGDSHTFVLPKQDNLDEARREASYEIVASMLGNSLKWAGGGHIPALTEVTDSADYKELVPQAHYAAATEQAIYEPKAWFTGSGSDFQARLGEALEPAFLGNRSADDAISALEERMTTFLQTAPPA